MRRAGSIILQAADGHKVPAGDALAVDREGFAGAVQAALDAEPNITIKRDVLETLPSAEAGPHIIATGPLTAPSLAEDIRTKTGHEALAFFDAIAPVVYHDSIDMDIAWRQSCYDKPGPGGDTAAYINCPLEKEQYETFLDTLIAAESTTFKDWEKDTPYFEGCLPIEVMAARGRETLRFGPMKPVGLTNPHREERAHAVVQLRQDNALGTLYNIVGFQTKLRHAEQSRVFRMIPGLENARFARLGGIHRNTFLDSPRVLDEALRLKNAPHIRFAGQITGVEGYVESAAIGLLSGRMLADELHGTEFIAPPKTTALGALLKHITGGHIAGEDTFQPMNVNFGLFPRLEGRMKKSERRVAMARRALSDIDTWLSSGPGAQRKIA
jgi:methylenetetrahydrofolate--tRNA-(uracil-5-)-methyltransferase